MKLSCSSGLKQTLAVTKVLKRKITCTALLLVCVGIFALNTYGGNPVSTDLKQNTNFDDVYTRFGDHKKLNQSVRRLHGKDVSPTQEMQQDKVTQIGFLKVHKAGSSTLTNMLFRFGVRHELSFALPKQSNYLHSKEAAMQLKRKDSFDILAVHTKFSEHLYSGVLPASSVKIAIVREPLTRATSAAYYYRDKFHIGYLERIPKDKFMKHLVNHPQLYEPKAFSNTKNTMGEDFGFSAHLQAGDQTAIHKYLGYLDKEFSLVLVMERFEESLVLMKRMFNWSIEDIVYLKTNSNPHTVANFTRTEHHKFRDTCFLDYAIYDFFSAVLDGKVKAQETGFQEEVDQFKQIVENTRRFCSDSNKFDRIIIPKSKWNEEFEITRTDCVDMKRSVLEYIDLLRKRHIKLNF